MNTPVTFRESVSNPASAAAAADQRLQAIDAQVVGMVLNDWDPSSSSHSYYAEDARGNDTTTQ